MEIKSVKSVIQILMKVFRICILPISESCGLLPVTKFLLMISGVLHKIALPKLHLCLRRQVLQRPHHRRVCQRHLAPRPLHRQINPPRQGQGKRFRFTPEAFLFISRQTAPHTSPTSLRNFAHVPPPMPPIFRAHFAHVQNPLPRPPAPTQSIEQRNATALNVGLLAPRPRQHRMLHPKRCPSGHKTCAPSQRIPPCVGACAAPAPPRKRRAFNPKGCPHGHKVLRK